MGLGECWAGGDREIQGPEGTLGGQGCPTVTPTPHHSHHPQIKEPATGAVSHGP